MESPSNKRSESPSLDGVCHLDRLPDHIIQTILSESKVVGCASGVFPYVCTRFRRLFAEPSPIWEHTSLCAWRDGPLRGGSAHDDHTLRRLQWLAPRGPSIRRCELHGWSGGRADLLFATLTGLLAAGEPPTELRAFDCEFTPKAFDSLLLLPTLRSLELGPITGTVDSCHLGMVLGTLTALTSLDLDFEWTEKGAIVGGFPTGLLDCTQLKRLHLSNVGDSALTALPADISRLQALDYLVLYDCGVASVPDTATKLTALTRLGIFQFQSPASEVSPLRLPDGLTAMRGLRELGLSLTAWRPELKALTFLTRLMVRHIATHEDAREFQAAFSSLRPALELTSDTDLGATDKNAFSVIQWEEPDEEFY